MIVAEATFIKNRNQFDIEGSVVFSQYDPDFVRVDIELINVPIGTHGIHVHEKPIKDFSAKDPCKQACAHFNGTLRRWAPNISDGTPHGSWSRGTQRHVGDLCNNITSYPSNVINHVSDVINVSGVNVSDVINQISDVESGLSVFSVFDEFEDEVFPILKSNVNKLLLTNNVNKLLLTNNVNKLLTNNVAGNSQSSLMNSNELTSYVSFSYYDDLISLIPDHPHNIVGRSVVIHEDPDDEGLLSPGRNIPINKIVESRITGNAGKRIACANIEYI